MNITVNGVNETVVLRAEKNAELTHAELDNNFAVLVRKGIENSASVEEINEQIGILGQSIQSTKDGIPTLDDITSRVASIETLLSGTNLVVNDNGIVYDPDDVANKKPYFDTPKISLWNEVGEFVDTMLTVSSSTSVDENNQDYHITINAVERESGKEFPLNDKMVVDLSKYYDEFIRARRVHINGKLVIEEGNIVGMSHIGGLTFLVYIGNEDTVTKVVKSSMMNFDDINKRTKEVFIYKNPKSEININIDNTLLYVSEKSSSYESDKQGNTNSGKIFEILFGTDSTSEEYPFVVKENSIGYHITFPSEELLSDDYNKFTNVKESISIVNENGTPFVNNADGSVQHYATKFSWTTNVSTVADYYSKSGWIESGEL